MYTSCAISPSPSSLTLHHNHFHDLHWHHNTCLHHLHCLHDLHCLHGLHCLYYLHCITTAQSPFREWNRVVMMQYRWWIHCKWWRFSLKILMKQHTATYCKHWTHCNTLQHTATHCHTLSHKEISRIISKHYCNTLQHIATHCDALWVMKMKLVMQSKSQSPTLSSSPTLHHNPNLHPRDGDMDTGSWLQGGEDP